MNSNTNNVPFHERHDDELLTLGDGAQILKTSENTVRVAPDGHRPGVLQDLPAALHDRRRPAEARVGLIYTEDPMMLASDLGLRPVESGANVILAAPRSLVVFERTSTWRDITIVAPSQAVADLLGGPGRNPAEGDYLLDWMKENPDAWRRQFDR